MKQPQRKIVHYKVLITFLSLWLNFISLLPRLAWAGTAMGDLAASMQPGTWAELSTNNINALLSNCNCATGAILVFGEGGYWDPASHKFFFAGADHAYDYTVL